MELSSEIIEFITKNENSDCAELLLKASIYPGINMPFAITQIEARRAIKYKLPSWYANKKLFFPSKIAAEQCSSEVTALYKRELVHGEKLCDLTGGLGIDSLSFASTIKQVIYVEQNPDLCKIARYNFNLLGTSNITVINSSAEDFISELYSDTIYLDPSRRSSENRRKYALADCKPDICQLKDQLLKRSKRVIVKLSPMADITETLRLLPETTEIHILSVKNDCKELLFVMSNQAVEDNSPPSVKIVTINFAHEREEHFTYTLVEEHNTVARSAEQIDKFLYEPNSSIMKSGAFKLITTRFDVTKLHRHSHLYTSERVIKDFPGRRFEIIETTPFSRKAIKNLAKRFDRLKISIRNFNLSVDELRKKSGIKDGGELYLFATTIAPNQPTLIVCKKDVHNA